MISLLLSAMVTCPSVISCKAVIQLNRQASNSAGLIAAKIALNSTAAGTVVILMDQDDSRAAVEAMRAGAQDCVFTSQSSLEDMPRVAERALNRWEQVTQRKRTAHTSQESEEYYKAFLFNLGDVAYEADVRGNVTYANRMAETVAGLPLSEIIGRPFLPLFEGDSQERAIDAYRESLDGGSPEFELTFRTGKVLRFRNGPKLDAGGNISGVFGIARDVTQRKRADEELQARSRVNEILLNAHDERMYADVLDLALELLDSALGTLVYFNENGSFVTLAATRNNHRDKCGVDEKELMFEKGTVPGICAKAIGERRTLYSNTGPSKTPEGHEPIENTIVTPVLFRDRVISTIHLANKPGGYEDRDATLLETIAEHLGPILSARIERDRQETERKRAEKLVQKANLRLDRRVRERTSQLSLANQTLRREIVERKRTEESLRHSEQKLAGIIASTTDAMFMVDSQYAVVWANDAAKRLSGSDPVGKQSDSVFRECNTPCKHCLIGKALADGMSHDHEREMVLSDGTRRTLWCVVNVAARDEEGRVSLLVVTARDVTEHKQAEKAIRVAERLNSLGTLSAGIAHEINNPVGAALLAAETALAIKDDTDQAEYLGKCLGSIIASMERCGQIVRDLLMFSQDEPTQKQPCQITEVIRQSRDLAVSYAQRRQITVRLASDRDLPEVVASRLDMELVLINLLRNAIRAGEEGGQVVIRAELTDAGVRIAVEDNGCGMTGEQTRNMFDPFYTTWQAQGGTGLGLSIAYSVVQDHGGTIDVDSMPGEGTTVIVTLPVPAGFHREGRTPALRKQKDKCLP